MFKKIFRKLFLIISIILFSSPSFAATDKMPIRIVFVLPLSGEWAFLGEGIRDGALLAAENYSSNYFNLELTFEDNGGDLTKSATIATRLLDQEKVDAFVSIISGVGQVLKPLASRKKVINIGICSDQTVADGNYSFINYLTAEQGVEKFLDQFIKTYGENKPLAIFSMNEAGFQKITETLEKDAAAIQIIRKENYNKGDNDFKPIILKTLKDKPEALLVLGLSPEIELIAKQLRSFNKTIPLLSIESFGLAADKSPFEGSWFIDSAMPNEKFQKRFKQKYGREVTIGVGYAHDSVLLIAAAFEKAQTSNREDVIREFQKINRFQGVIGELSVQKDGVIRSEPSVKFIKNGKVVF